jgi:hypothetical protein
MLQSIKQLLGNKLGASDGDIGHVKDCYFDDQSWAVRYLVADTGSWLPGRQVLLAPHAIGGLRQAKKGLNVKLTRKQIENSPAIEEHKPVTRQHEEEYHRYYGWPAYWLGDGMWGANSASVLETPPNTFPAGSSAASGSPSKHADAHLRSTQAVSGYHLQATDGIVGHVCDFLVDPKTWAIRELVVKTGHRFSGNEVLVPVSNVDRVSYDDSTVFVKSTKLAVEQSPTNPPMSAAAISDADKTPLLL